MQLFTTAKPKRTYIPRSPEATQRRQATGQYNWALFQLRSILAQTSGIRNSLGPDIPTQVWRDLRIIQNTTHNILDKLEKPETRKKWMEKRVG